MPERYDKSSGRQSNDQGPSTERGSKDQAKTKQARKQALVDQLKSDTRAGLRPDDIGVVRVEFTVPASRLFGNFTAGGRTVPIVTADNDTDDPVEQRDTDNKNIPLVGNPGPGHFDQKDGQ